MAWVIVAEEWAVSGSSEGLSQATPNFEAFPA